MEPEEQVPGLDPADFVLNARRQTQATAIDGLGADPEKAARAQTLAEATGVPAPLVLGDLENFEFEHKAGLTSQLLKDNRYLAQFVDSNPMAASIANDDYGQLDLVSKALNKVGEHTPFARGLISGILRSNPKTSAKALEGLSHLVPEEFAPVLTSGAKELHDVAKLLPDAYKRQTDSMWNVKGLGELMTWAQEAVGEGVASTIPPLITGIGGGIVGGRVGGKPGAVVGAGIGALTPSALMNYGEVYEALEQAKVDPKLAAQWALPAAAVMATLDVASLGPIIARLGGITEAKREVARALGARIAAEGGKAMGREGLTEMLQEVVKDLTVSVAADLPLFTLENMKGWLESGVVGSMTGGVVGSAAGIVPDKIVKPAPEPKLNDIYDAYEAASVYLRTGQEPPIGLHKMLDDMKIDQSKEELDRLDEAQKEAQASKLRERNPEIFADFIRQHTDANIGISAEAVLKLYGDNPPAIGDGLLGDFISPERLASAIATGEDVQVPLADWLAKVEPELAKELHDDIRVRREGVTVNEAEALKEGRELEALAAEKVEAVKEPQPSDDAPRIPLARLLKEGDMGTSPFLLPSGEIISTGGDHLSMANVQEQVQQGLVRFRYGENRTGRMSLGVGLVQGQELTPKQRAVLDRLSHNADVYVDVTQPHDNSADTHKDLPSAIEAAKPKKEPLKPPPQPVGAEPVDAVRKAAGLPVDIKKLKLHLADVDIKGWTNQGRGAVYNFDLLDQAGKPAANLTISEREDGRVLLVENITTVKVHGDGYVSSQFRPNFFGTKVMMDVLEQVKATFPKAEEIIGVRVSGARVRSAGQRMGLGDWDALESGGGGQLARMPLKAPTSEELSRFLESFRGQKRKPLFPKGSVVGGGIARVGTSEATVLYSFPLENILSELDQSHLEGISKNLYKLIGDRLTETVGDVPVKVIDQSDMWQLYQGNRDKKEPDDGDHLPGFYDPPSNTIYVSDLLMTEELSKRQRKGPIYVTETILHEAVHAFAVTSMHNDPVLKGHVQAMLNEAKAFFAETDPQGLKEFAYAFTDADEFLAEAMANSKFQKALALMPISKELATKLGLNRGLAVWKAKPNAWDAVRKILKDLLEQLVGVKIDETMLDAVLQVGKILEEKIAPQGREGLRPRKQEPTGEGPQQPMDEKAPFTSDAFGRTLKETERYLDLIAQRQLEDIDAATERAMRDQRKRQTAEWKENEKVERAEAVATIKARPDVSADAYLRDGELFGEKVDRLKLATDSVPEDVRKKLPRDYFQAKGVKPDDIAALFGYHDGKSLVERLVAYNEQLKSSNMRRGDFVRRLITQETEKRMQAKYGDLESKILEEAKDQAISDTQLQLLHEDVIRIGSMAGIEVTINKEELKSAVKQAFEQTLVSDVSKDAYLAAAGRAGRLVERFLLEGKAKDAFKEAQRQYHAMLMATEAKKLQKDQEAFEKLTNKFSSRQVKGVDQQFTNFIHTLMLSGDLKVKRSLQDIEDAIDRDGNTTLEAFVLSKQQDGWDIDVAPDIIDDPKPVDKMTVEEFREYKDALDSLAYIGRETEKIEVKGQKVEFEDFRREVLSNIKTLPIRTPKERETSLASLKRGLWFVDASLVRMEEMMKDLDLRQELGPLFNAVIRPMMDAKHKEYQLQEALAKKLAAIKGFNKEWQKTLDDSIPQDFFFDPYYDGEVLFDMTRANMINIMLNFGNKSNIGKFTKGYGGKESAQLEGQLRQLFDEHATKEDWDFVQQMWDIFEEWKGESDTLYHNLSGLAPKSIKSEPIQTRFGEYKGGYFPIMYDRLRSNIDVIKEKKGPEGLFKENYHRATTGNRYTKDRTGYVDKIEFQTSVESVAARMQQQIHDIAYRAAVMNVGKVIYDKQIRAAIRKHYGPEYEAQLSPWLEDVANHFNMDEQANAWARNLARRARMNLSAHALGLNLKVIFSPDVGQLNPVAVGRTLGGIDAATEFAWEHSKEIPHSFRNMDRDYRERLEALISAGKWESLQADAVRWSFMPLVKVSQGFRIITFNDEYQKAVAKGFDDADASALADSAVRERHGSTGLPDLPAIMRGGEFLKTSTIFYGFFSAMYQWQRQIPGMVRSQEYMKAMGAAYGSILIPAAFGALLFNKSDDDDSWFKKIGKALLLQPLQTIPFVREAASYVIEGFPSRTPWFTLVDALSKGGRDIVKLIKGEKVERPIQDAGNVIGLGLGLPFGQIGRSAQFLHDVHTKKQRPKNILEWIKGLTFGQIKS